MHLKCQQNLVLTSYYDEDEEEIDSKNDDDDGGQRNPLALLVQIISEALVILRPDRFTEYKESYNCRSIIMKPFRYVGSVAG